MSHNGKQCIQFRFKPWFKVQRRIARNQNAFAYVLSFLSRGLMITKARSDGEEYGRRALAVDGRELSIVIFILLFSVRTNSNYSTSAAVCIPVSRKPVQQHDVVGRRFPTARTRRTQTTAQYTGCVIIAFVCSREYAMVAWKAREINITVVFLSGPVQISRDVVSSDT
jgi:hypothetical protein